MSVRNEEIELDLSYSIAELRASADEVARTVVKQIFEVFNWNDPDDKNGDSLSCLNFPKQMRWDRSGCPLLVKFKFGERHDA